MILIIFISGTYFIPALFHQQKTGVLLQRLHMQALHYANTKRCITGIHFKHFWHCGPNTQQIFNTEHKSDEEKLYTVHLTYSTKQGVDVLKKGLII